MAWPVGAWSRCAVGVRVPGDPATDVAAQAMRFAQEVSPPHNRIESEGARASPATADAVGASAQRMIQSRMITATAAMTAVMVQ